ncbi:hypothetical protein FY145_07210 [Agrobacterium tumefaciens]|uniref:Uncharacterized protein n=1 Tax=Agrobacterium tumefaciens TaxID=358 RepID=A0AAP9E3A8_AGRTU|nr:hypothetical protein [Agrobacterium tumefaciens]NSZ57818.1 hypothetical protein [Agrobacterium tumefaciens]QDY93937.1 hypothetical protein CG010_007210 [Agrobacterium tumefaciens]UXS49009.1 hypothetical protein FY149_17330 [Agrobacterium tumefaciens]UXS70313.1 hypothetical protein FY146_07210 [Agrobacterium tumefaciens]UXS77975.1 hypothetical protein FY145_07210 [Agrobacterium tumefaciens]
MAEEQFNPLDPFDAATDVLRREIASAVACHWTETPVAQLLDDEGKFQSICVALTVCLAASMKAMTNLSDKEAITIIKKSLPNAFKTAAGIMESLESDGETKH